MGQILHGSARTTEAVRRAIQHSQEGLKVLAVRYGISEKTVAKWRKRDFVHDAPMGPKEPASTVLMKEEEAICVAFRKHSCCRWMIACTRFRPRFHTCPGQLCTAAFQDMASTDCQMPKAISL